MDRRQIALTKGFSSPARSTGRKSQRCTFLKYKSPSRLLKNRLVSCSALGSEEIGKNKE